MMTRLDRFLGQLVSMRSLAVVRILVGLVVLIHLRPFVELALHGNTYQDHFYQPYLSWYPELPEAGYTALLVLGCLAAVAMSIGLWSNVTTKLTVGIVAYNLFLSTTNLHNNRAYLVIVLGILAMAPCGRALSLDAWWARRRGRPYGSTGPAWTLWLLRFECATVYAASGMSKLLDPDWRDGVVPWGRLVEQEAAVRSSFLPGGVADLLLNRTFHEFAAPLIIATELFIAGGLWWRRTRPFALAVAVLFHIAIQFTANVEVFSYLGVAVLFAWADPALPWLNVPRRLAASRKPGPATPTQADAPAQ